MSLVSEKLLEFARRGDKEKVKWLKNISRNIQPSQKMRIQQNDKSVLKELILPSWVSWDMLYTWAMETMEHQGKQACIVCSNITPLGTNFKGKFFCGECIADLKSVLTVTNTLEF